PAPEAADAVDLRAVGAGAARVVRGYYRALDAKDFITAWSRLAPALQQQIGSLAKWQAGYKNTVASEVTAADPAASDAAHASVTVQLHTTDLDACGRHVAQRFSGRWTLSRFNGRWLATAVSMR